MNTYNKIIIIILTPVLLLLSSCKTETNDAQTDLMKYGMPIKITAPADAQFTSEDFGLMKDVTVKSGTDYSIQIFSSQAIDRDITSLVEKQKMMVQSEDFFDSISEEVEGGFIYKKNIDGTEDYDFRYVKIVGDSEYLFQTGLVGTFSLDQVKSMLESVK